MSKEEKHSALATGQWCGASKVMQNSSPTTLVSHIGGARRLAWNVTVCHPMQMNLNGSRQSKWTSKTLNTLAIVKLLRTLLPIIHFSIKCQAWLPNLSGGMPFISCGFMEFIPTWLAQSCTTWCTMMGQVDKRNPHRRGCHLCGQPCKRHMRKPSQQQESPIWSFQCLSTLQNRMQHTLHCPWKAVNPNIFYLLSCRSANPCWRRISGMNLACWMLCRTCSSLWMSTTELMWSQQQLSTRMPWPLQKGSWIHTAFWETGPLKKGSSCSMWCTSSTPFSI